MTPVLPPRRRAPGGRDWARVSPAVLIAGVAAVGAVLIALVFFLVPARTTTPSAPPRALPAPVITVTVAPSPSPDRADGDGFAALLLARLEAARVPTARCVWARPGVDAPVDVRGSALVEVRGEAFQPSAPPKIVRMPYSDAAQAAQAGEVLVHRWCTA